MRPRVSIAALMGVVAVVALGAVALREANELWASAVFTLTLGILGLACLGAAFRRGTSRAAFAGFAAFGLGYMFLCFGPWASSEIRPNLVTTKLLEWAGPRVIRFRPAPQVLSDLSTRLAVPHERRPHEKIVFVEYVEDSGSWRPARATGEFLRVGHSLFALLAALIGGLAARYFYDTRTPQPPAPRRDAP